MIVVCPYCGSEDEQIARTVPIRCDECEAEFERRGEARKVFMEPKPADPTEQELER